jgi:hypothetical protein
VNEKQIARFQSRVDKRGPGECWPWTGAVNARGYGVAWDGARTRLAHRVAWFIEHGSWPEDCLLHKCDNPPCCNPAHAFQGTRADNHLDMCAKRRQPPMPPQPKGELHSHAVLTEVNVREIRARAAAGEPRKLLAAEFLVTASNIDAIVQRRSWRHVT